MLAIYKKFIRDEKGAASVVEAALVYPAVILSVISLIYAGMYIYEVSALDILAERTAAAAAKTVAFTGYDELGDIYSSLGFSTDGDKPDRSHTEKAYEAENPYRYLVKGEADSRFAQSVSEYASEMLFSSDDIVCTVDVKRRLFDRRIDVTIEKEVRMPSVLKMLGVMPQKYIIVTESAVTEDTAEFIRNTDLVFNAAEYLGCKTGISEKLSNVKSRISGILEKIKAGMK